MKLGVAPMEGITIFPTRLWLHWASAPDGMTTPFLRVTEVFPEATIPTTFLPELSQLRGLLPYELTPQLMAANPEHFLRAAELFPESFAPTLEINCGCPSPNSAGRTAGSGALRDAEWFGDAIERLSSTLGPGRLAVKMRLGFASSDEFATLLQRASRPAVARLTVHGRTRADGYRGAARWDLISEASRQTLCPVWGSGDIIGRATFSSWQAAAPQAAGVLIGRGVMRNPWIFEELRQKQTPELTTNAFADALLAFVLVQELWQRCPKKFLAKLATGKWSQFVGTASDGWEHLAVSLTSLAFGVPSVARTVPHIAAAAVSNVALSRLKMLWGYLRASLPPELQCNKLPRTKTLAEFFTRYFELAPAVIAVNAEHLP